MTSTTIEPVKVNLRLNYTVMTEVVNVEEVFKREHISGVGPNEVAKQVSQGWFVTFSGSRESLYFGDLRPDFQIGDKVKITFAHE